MNKLKTNHLNATGPARGNELAHGHHRPARPKRERGGDGPTGRQPTAWLGLASRGTVTRRGARWRDGAARPAAGGRLRPWQRKPASAIGVRGYGANEQAAKHG